MSSRMPALFIGHGNPMYAITANPYAERWRRIGPELPRPKAILCISAHWYVRHAAVTAMECPRTIHDFGGFPAELFAVQYEAPGCPELARRVQQLLQPVPVELDEHWGLDHGTWAPLRHIYPKADVPVVQLSLDATQPAAFHYELGQRLAPLREEGVLIVGSGNLVHNLREYSWNDEHAAPADWALHFEHEARMLMDTDKEHLLVHYQQMGRNAMLAAPTPEHYLPLLYVLGARQKGDAVSYPVEGFDGGSMSMLAVRVG